MASVTLEVPDDVVARLKKTGGEVSRELRIAAAFSLCSRGELSTSQAARLADMTYAEFLEAAARAKVELFPINVREFTEEVSRGFTLGRERLADHPPGESRTG
jgi:predicted HTH domain antitoxin